MSAPRRGLVSAALSTAIAFAILIALGIWQLERREWKARILAAVDRAEQAPPIPLHGTPPPFTKIIAEGVLDRAVALYGVDVRPGRDGADCMGAQRLQILTLPDGMKLLVDLGWVPTEGAAPPVAAGPASITGYLRAPDRAGLFSPADNAAARRFYTLDPAAIGTALGTPHVAPFTLVALGRPLPDAPEPADALPRPPNNHLQYAFTWFGLAGALVIVFGAYATRR